MIIENNRMQEAIDEIKHNVANAAEKSGRRPEDICC